MLRSVAQRAITDILALANTWTAKQTFGPIANDNAFAASNTLSGSNTASIADFSSTWNTSGIAKAITLTVTDTASSASSLLLDMKVGASSVFTVSKTGLTTIAAGMSVAGGYVSAKNSGSTAVFAATNAAGNTTFFRIFDDNVANVVAVRNTTVAQTLRWYRTFTDASNYERGALTSGSGYMQIAVESAGSGTANMDLYLLPVGTGTVRFGTHSAIAAETVTGYITMKDAGGTTRKIAVVS